MTAAREYQFTRKDFDFLRRLSNERTGIVVTDDKFDMFYSRLARRVRALASQLGRGVPPAVLGGVATFGLTYGIAQLFDFDAMASALKTALSVVIVIVGTAVFVGVAILIGSLLHDWLFGSAERSSQPAAGPEPEPEWKLETEPEPGDPSDAEDEQEWSEY